VEKNTQKARAERDTLFSNPQSAVWAQIDRRVKWLRNQAKTTQKSAERKSVAHIHFSALWKIEFR
jgi:hypothetical protein